MSFIHRVQAILVMNSLNGSMLFGKYYSGPSTPAASRHLGEADVQRELEKAIFEGAQRRLSKFCDVTQVKEHNVVYICHEDLVFAVVGDATENQMVLSKVLETLVNTLLEFPQLQEMMDARQLEENYELLVLTVDEMIDEGIILEVSYAAIVESVEEINISSGDLPGREMLSHLNKIIRDNL